MKIKRIRIFIFSVMGGPIADWSKPAPSEADVENIPTLLPFGDTLCQHLRNDSRQAVCWNIDNRLNINNYYLYAV
tara:strand:+ start:1270 stop:1494 length:225 start_codon:yes stop_codon:yes gene_type:complete